MATVIGSFATDEAVLLLMPAITRDLMDAHRDFHQMLGDLKIHEHGYYQPGRWVPHVTMAQNVQDEMMGRAFDVMRKSFRPITGNIIEAGLVRFKPLVSLGCFGLSADK